MWFGWDLPRSEVGRVGILPSEWFGWVPPGEFWFGRDSPELACLDLIVGLSEERGGRGWGSERSSGARQPASFAFGYGSCVTRLPRRFGRSVGQVWSCPVRSGLAHPVWSGQVQAWSVQSLRVQSCRVWSVQPWPVWSGLAQSSPHVIFATTRKYTQAGKSMAGHTCCKCDQVCVPPHPRQIFGVLVAGAVNRGVPRRVLQLRAGEHVLPHPACGSVLLVAREARATGKFVRRDDVVIASSAHVATPQSSSLPRIGVCIRLGFGVCLPPFWSLLRCPPIRTVVSGGG